MAVLKLSMCDQKSSSMKLYVHICYLLYKFHFTTISDDYSALC